MDIKDFIEVHIKKDNEIRTKLINVNAITSIEQTSEGIKINVNELSSHTKENIYTAVPFIENSSYLIEEDYDYLLYHISYAQALRPVAVVEYYDKLAAQIRKEREAEMAKQAAATKEGGAGGEPTDEIIYNAGGATKEKE